jgi:hypothetical protein
MPQAQTKLYVINVALGRWNDDVTSRIAELTSEQAATLEAQLQDMIETGAIEYWEVEACTVEQFDDVLGDLRTMQQA